MPDVVLSTDDLTVLGGPSSISVDVDFGPAGQRGSLIYASVGNPNNSGSGIPADVLPYDVAINISTSDARYLTVYQYISADGVDSWQELTRLSPNAGSVNVDVSFSSGSGIVAIPVSSITESTTLDPSNFNIQYAIESLTPILSSLTISPSFQVVDDVSYLAFSINAVEFNGVTFAAVDSVTKTVHLFITVVGD